MDFCRRSEGYWNRGVQDWTVCVDVEVPSIKAGIGLSRETLSQVLNRGAMSSADDSVRKVERIT